MVGITFLRSKMLRLGASAVLTLVLLCGMAWLLKGQIVAPAGAAPIAAGLITNGPTVNDASFNWSAYQGLLRAENELGVVGTVYTSPSAADYGPNLQKCIDDGNDVCITVGFSMADATRSKASANPGVRFAIVDYTWDDYPANLRGITFASDEVGYLAGVLAARMTQSHVIGTVGGMRIPPVDSFIGGYRNGARCTNPDVTVAVTYTNSFGDPAQGTLAAQELLAEGADVVFAVAGGTGNGALLTTTQSGAWGIGVDTDQYTNLFQNGSVAGSDKLLSSAMKRVDNTVFDTIADVAAGTFTPGSARYNLATEGVGLAPYHAAASSIPPGVQAEVDSIRQLIISGALDVNVPCGKSVGLVTDAGGLADNAFNWLSYQGLLRAESELGVAGTVYISTEFADYEPNLRRCVDDGNLLCVSVGFLMTDATANVARAYPGTHFAIVDVVYSSYPANLRGINFASDEAGYLAGTLAGLMTQSDVVGTIGGMPIPPVDLFLTGYRNGARHANHGVKMLVTYTNDFTRPDLGAQAAQAMMAQGADVIFPAAGPTGNGALLTATQAGSGVSVLTLTNT